MGLTLFLLLLVVSLIVTGGFAIYALRHRQRPGARPFTLILFGYGLYTIWCACELLADSLAFKIIWDNLQFTATDIIAIGYLWFAMEYTRRSAALRWLMPWCGGILALNALLVWTNPAHHLVYSASEVLVQGNVSFLTYTYEPWFWCYLGYSLFGTLAAGGVLFITLARAARFYQLQVGAMIIGILVPLVGTLLSVSRSIPFSELANLDINPIAYLCITPLWGWALFRERFLDLMPMARGYLVEAMSDGILVIDRQGRVVDCNAGAQALLPALHEPCIGTAATTMLPALAPLLTDEPRRTVIETSGMANTADDAQRWLEIRSTPLHDPGKHPVGWLVIVHDQTERGQMEEALREQNVRLEREIAERQEAEEAYRNLVQFSFQGLMIIQEERVVFANPAIETILGYTVAELQTMSPEERMALVHPDDRAEVRRFIHHNETQHIPIRSYEHRIVGKDGQTRWVEVYVTVVTFRGASAMQLTVLDTTERKHAEEALRESEARLKAVFDNAAVGIALTNKAGQSLAFNEWGAQQLGYTPAELTNTFHRDLTHPDDRALSTEHTLRLLCGEIQGYRVEKRYVRKDGSILWVDLSVSPVYDDAGQIAYLLGIMVDITERKHAEESLREREQFIQNVATTIPGILYVYDLTLHRNVYSNRQMWEVLGYTSEEFQALGSNALPSLLHPDDVPQVLHHLMRHEEAEDGKVLYHEYRVQHRDGEWRWLHSREVVFLRNDEGQPRQVLGIAQDITERKRLEEQLREANTRLHEQATRDPLTGLHNRRYLDETLPRELQRAERHHQPIGVIMLDIDHFKHFNDTYGHDAGDTLLRAVGSFLQRNTRGEDIACRYGGEEFTLVLPGAALADTRQRADKLCTGIQKLVVEYHGSLLDTVTASFGVAVFPDHATTADDLVRAADRALYQAKQGGRNGVYIAGGYVVHKSVNDHTD